MSLEEEIQKKIDNKTKPLGALGLLEDIAIKICTIQNTTLPELNHPHHILFAADHGIAQSGVSAYPAEVTQQMVSNILHGGAAINVFCSQHDIKLLTVDAGVNTQFDSHPNLITHKINFGTKNFLHHPAMTENELNLCFQYSEKLIENIYKKGCNIIGFGEMGIGNTSSASMIMHYICQIPLEDCIGVGTGLNTNQLENKKNILYQARSNHGDLTHAREILKTFGGFEIAQMCAAMIASYKKNMIILIDGFISTSALLIAHKLYPKILKNTIFTHKSDEKGHALMLQYLGATPILNMNMRLGEGIGCALAYPLIVSSVKFIHEMSSFQDTGISTKV